MKLFVLNVLILFSMLCFAQIVRGRVIDAKTIGRGAMAAPRVDDLLPFEY